MPNYTIKTKYAGDTAQLIKKLEIPSHSQILKDVSKKRVVRKGVHDQDGFVLGDLEFYQFDF